LIVATDASSQPPPNVGVHAVKKSVVALAFVGALAACAGDSPMSPASASIAGTYHLQTINGSALPFAIQSGANVVVVTNDAITVADGGTWSEQATFTVTSNGQTSNQVISDGGTWTRAGQSVSLNSKSTGGYAGTFTGTGFEFFDSSFTYVFVR
jgi:hypothetical protein